MSLQIYGINYDTGTEFVSNEYTRKEWNVNVIQSDFHTIKNDLNCNTINLYGTNKERILEAIQIALNEDLNVFAQLRCIDKTKDEMQFAVVNFAEAITELGKSDRIVLNIGCEASLFTRGFIPGGSFLSRMDNMIWIWPFFTLINRSLSTYLQKIVNDVRKVFNGKIIYASGSWENINWHGFDYLGVNLYKDRENGLMYNQIVKDFGEKELPVVITEFGCSTFTGASLAGGGGWTIIDYQKDPPKLKRNVERNEKEQSELLVDSINLFNKNGLFGCFIFDFIETQQLFSENPMYDLDKASYGIVKAMEKNETIIWEKKEAFAKVSELYKTLTTI